MQEYTLAQVAQHNKDGDAWVVVGGKVFDVSKFARMHPGGKGILLEYAGKDATQVFYQFHRHDIFKKYEQRLVIGTLSKSTSAPTPPPGSLSEVPFAECSADQHFKTVYFKDSHHVFRRNLRAFLETEVYPNAPMWEETGKFPVDKIYKQMGEKGLLGCRLAPGVQGKLFKQVFGIPANEFDSFHELIAHEEVTRIGCPGLIDGLGSGYVIGLPPIIHFASKAIQEKVIPECVYGTKKICLAITEPIAGSDVSNIACTAVKTPCGKFYKVNGVKKWITNGVFSDYFVTAVRTGGKGIGGISLLLIERSKGLETEPIKTSYSACAGTAYITYEDVLVPVENLLGKENQGFRCIMANFNHERWYICVAGNRINRLAAEECFKWANQRQVFGRKLIEQPVIRNKLAQIVAGVEACQNWLENITYQMQTMNYSDQSKYLAGPLALLKYNVTRTTKMVFDNASQIFGGRAISRSGMGQVIERNARAQKFGAILGGSEEIMADLAIRQSMRFFPKDAML